VESATTRVKWNEDVKQQDSDEKIKESHRKTATKINNEDNDEK